MNNYTKENLFNLSIHEVRRIGRAVGVRSPTSLKKEDLIDQIIAISSGLQEKYVAKDKKGRPSKAGFELEQLLNFNWNEKPKSFFSSTLTFNAKNEFENELLDSKVFPAGEFEGYLDLSYSNIGVLKSKLKMGLENCALIPSSLILKNNLKFGDFVKVEVSKLENGKMFATEVLKVNNKTDVEKKEDFLCARPKLATKKIEFENDFVLNQVCPIGFGQRAVAFDEDSLAVKSFITTTFKKAKCEKILVLFDSQVEEEELWGDNEQVICIPSGPQKEVNALVNLIINVLHRKAESGKDVVAFVYGGRQIRSILHDKSEEYSLPSEIITSFKNTQNCGSCGLVLGVTATKDEAEEIFAGSFNLLVPLCSNLAMYGVETFIDIRKLSIFRTDEFFLPSSKQIIAKIKQSNIQNEEDLASVINSLK